MSVSPEIQRYIRREIERQMNVILSGVAGDGDGQTETIDNLYPGSDGMTKRPKASPYGFVSIAKRGTISVVAKQGENTANRIVLLHRDANAPKVKEGESKMYSEPGYQLYAALNGLFCGKGEADQPIVLGTALNTLLGQILDLLKDHVHPGVGSPPSNAAQFVSLKTQTITPKKILATSDGGLP